MMRYASIPLIATSLLVCSIAGCRRRGVFGLLAGCAIGLMCGASYLAMAIWRVSQGQAPLGPRFPSRFSYSDVLSQLIMAIGGYISNREDSVALNLLGFCLAASIFGPVLWFARRSLTGYQLIPIVVWVGLYLCFLVMSVATTWIDPLGYRFLAPIHTSALALVLLAVRGAIGERLWIAVPASAYLVGFVASTATWAHGQSWFSYADEVARLNQSAAQLEAHIPQGANIVSDDPSVVAWVTSRDEIRGFPDAGPAPTGPYWARGDRFESAQTGDYMIIVDGGEQSATKPRGVLVFRGDGYTIYRVVQ
jgi:hypothetical protein